MIFFKAFTWSVFGAEQWGPIGSPSQKGTLISGTVGGFVAFSTKEKMPLRSLFMRFMRNVCYVHRFRQNSYLRAPALWQINPRPVDTRTPSLKAADLYWTFACGENGLPKIYSQTIAFTEKHHQPGKGSKKASKRCFKSGHKRVARTEKRCHKTFLYYYC